MIKTLFIINCYIISLLYCSIGYSQPFSWEQTNGPNGGQVYSILILENDEIFISTLEGIFRSVNNGDSWSKTGHVPFAGCLIRNSKGEIFAASDGVYRSTDNGENWEKILSINAFITSLAVNEQGHIFAGSYINDNPGHSTLVYRSTDNGESWEKVGLYSTGLTTHVVKTIIIDTSGVIFAGGRNDNISDNGGVYRSTDNGESWSQTSLKDLSVFRLKLDPENNILAGTSNGVFRSPDGGDSWTRLNGLNERAVCSLAFNPDGEIIAGIRKHGVYLFSHNRWENITSNLPTRCEIIINVDSDGNFYAASSYDGMFRSINHGNSWYEINNGLVFTHVETIISNKRGEIFAGTKYRGIFYSNDNGDSWTQTELCDAEIRTLAINSSGDIFAGSCGGIGIQRSNNNGIRWEKVGLDSTVVNSILITANDDIFVGTHDGLFKSTDNGDTWAQIGIPDTAVVWSLAMNSKNEMFAVVHYPYYGNAIFRSTGYGQTWIESGLEGIYTRIIAINSDNIIFVGTSYDGGVFYSEDDGKTWHQTGLNSSSISVSSIVFNGKGDIFVGSYRGSVHLSTDNGLNWYQIDNGLKEPNVSSLAISSEGYLFAGTAGNGVYRSLESTEPPGSITIQSLILDQNYPNPFNSSTTIQFSIPKSSKVTLKIIDAIGRDIMTLVDKKLEPGNYNVVFKAQTLPSGTYFYRLQADEFSASKKLLLLK